MGFPQLIWEYPKNLAGGCVMEPDIDDGFDLFGSLIDDHGSSDAGMRHHEHMELHSNSGGSLAESYAAEEDDASVQLEERPSCEGEANDDGSANNGDSGSFNFGALLNRAMGETRADEFTLPWESSEWKCIFDPNHDPLDALVPDFEPKLKVPKVHHDVVEASNASSAEMDNRLVDYSQPAYILAVADRSDLLWTEKREAELQRALKKWSMIIGNWPGEWQCVRAVLDCDSVGASMVVIADYFNGKAPSTLVKRANSMLFLMESGRSIGLMFPYNEPDFYHLLKTLKAAGTSTSRLKGVLEAVAFCRFVFQLEDLQVLSTSKRCRGAVDGGPQGRVNQAAPLLVKDVLRLHHILEEGQLWDAVFAGAALFCINSRARWSDFIHGSCIRTDMLPDGTICYADMEVHIHKTMHAAAHRFQFMDLVASGIGIGGRNWIRCWIDAMMSLDMEPTEPKIGGSLMPAPGKDGKPMKRSLDSDEASSWLRLLLGEKLDRKSSSRPISSHSLKATLLSIAAKRGLRPEDRLIMGHHCHPFKMADVYAREAQARTIRLVDKLILELRSGFFDPDATGAGRFNKAAIPNKLDDVGPLSLSDHEGLLGLVSKEVDSDLSQAMSESMNAAQDPDDDFCSDSSGEESDDSVEMTDPGPGFEPPKVPAGFKFMQNRRTKTLHLVDLQYPSSTCCGRFIDSAFYVDVNSKCKRRQYA